MRVATKTKDLVLRTALELFVEKGITATTIRDIATKGKIAEGTLYRYFTSKDALAKELYETHCATVAHDIQALRAESHDFESFLSSLIIYLCQTFDKDIVLFQYVFLLSPNDFNRLKVTGTLPQDVLCDAVTETFKKRGQVDRDAELVTAQIMGSILQTAHYKICGKLPRAFSYYADELVFAVFRILRD
jgi:AcrR family transcriptional regulator